MHVIWTDVTGEMNRQHYPEIKHTLKRNYRQVWEKNIGQETPWKWAIIWEREGKEQGKGSGKLRQQVHHRKTLKPHESRKNKGSGNPVLLLLALKVAAKRGEQGDQAERSLCQWLHTTAGSCAGEAALTGKASWSGQGSTRITGGESQGGARKRMRNSETGMNDQVTNFTLFA